MNKLRFNNPFHDLWVTEILDPNDYVRMFSPLLVSDAEELFSSGNVVIKGRQGSGKSMLLNLLETETRIAYEMSSTEYPVPVKQRTFISAGVQLTRESASLVATRADEISDEQRVPVIATIFADYLNTLLALDLLRNVNLVNTVQQSNEKILPEIRIQLDEKRNDLFVRDILAKDSWRGFVDMQCKTIVEIISSLENRLRSYRNFFNYNIDALPQKILESRSPAGLPLADLAAALRENEVVPANTLILLRIDQHEELFELERHSGLGQVFRQVINAALSKRDSRIAYRIGTRHYAWNEQIAAWGSNAPLEEMRDYSVINLDAILKRGEHAKGWKFPMFARDVVSKRLEASGYPQADSALETLFGRSIDPAEKAKKYAGKSAISIKCEIGWAKEWVVYLEELANSDPLEAKLGEAWLRQAKQIRGKVSQNNEYASALRKNYHVYKELHATTNAEIHEIFPWRASPWWVKERNEIALMQIAAERQQALIWSGERQMIDLAGHNILAFMTLCKAVWSTWQRRNPGAADIQHVLPSFSIDDQVIGVAEASHLWFKKIQVGLEADQRSRFVSALGRWFRKRLIIDKAMSNPGHSGFSLVEEELRSNRLLVQIIKSCRDHGDLLESHHTTKNKDQIQRLKWYLHPLLCPIFRIPHIRTKEPIYTTVAELQSIYDAQKRRGVTADELAHPEDDVQMGLPGI